MKEKKQVRRVIRVRPDVHKRLLLASVRAERPVHEFASDALAAGLRVLEKPASKVSTAG